jgi:broad specificity phosphatase PhoE
MSDTIIDLIRHGEPQGGRRFRGNGCDDPLSEKGWAQMRQAVAGQAPWQGVISSPMQRCTQFAEEVAQRHKLPMSVDERLREVGFGSWEGFSPAQLLERNRQEFDDFYRDPVNCRPPGAEDLELFSQRVQAALSDALSAYHGQHLLVVAHAGVIRAALGGVLAAPPERWYRVSVSNAHLTRIRYGAHGATLDAHNVARMPL